MTDLIDNAASENSENEEINKLFPRCKPKISSDINLNKISLNEGDIHPYHYSLENNANEINSVKIETTINNQTNNKNDLKCNVMENHNIRKSESMFNVEKSDHDSCEEDHSVVSAYETFGVIQSSHDHLTSPKYDCTSDVLSDELMSNCCSNSLNHQEFKLRESRIEIAGGREIFSFSRSRLSKRRFNDEAQNASHEEKDKRITSDMNDDKLHGYRFHSQKNIAKFLASEEGEKQFKNSSGNNVDECFQQMEWESLETSQVENVQSKSNNLRQNNTLFVYETHVKGSEVIYDDIGDWEENPSAKEKENVRLKNASENGTCYQEEIEIMNKPLTASLEAINSEDGLITSSEEFPTSPYGIHEKSGDNMYLISNKLDMHCDSCTVPNNTASESSNFEEVETEMLTPHLRQVEKSMKLIGNLPIAEYDGSPRRYGPRPGHPERVFADVPSVCDFSEKLQLLHMQSCVSDSKPEEDTPKIAPYFSDVHSNNKIVQKKDLHSSNPENSYEVNYNNVCGEIQAENSISEFYPNNSQIQNGDKEFKDLEYKLYRVNTNNSYIGRRLAQFYSPCLEESPKKLFVDKYNNDSLSHQYANNCNPCLDSTNKLHIFDGNTTDFINNSKDIFLLRQSEEPILVDGFDQDCETISTNPDTEDLAETEMGEQVGHSRNFTLSPETTDCDSNDVESEVSFENEDSLNSSGRAYGSMPVLEDGLSSGHASDAEEDADNDSSPDRRRHHSADNPTTLLIKKQISEIEKEIARCSQKNKIPLGVDCHDMDEMLCQNDGLRTCLCSDDADLEYLDPLRQATPPPPAPHPYRKTEETYYNHKESVDEAIKEIKQAIQKTKAMTMKSQHVERTEESDKPVWIPRPLFSQQSLADDLNKPADKEKHEDGHEDECDTDQETDRLLGKQRSDDKGFFEERDKDHKKKGRSKEVLIHEPAVLIEGVLFRARYLGSTQLVCEGQPTKATRMMQAEEAVSRIKAPEGENQPSTEVDLFISTEKIMVLNTDLKEIMMDHSLRTISYIADIGDLVVLMARRRMMNCQEDQEPKIRRTPKMICHVFESEEAQFIAQSIGQAFQVAYMEFLKANGIEDHSFVKEMDYQEVLNSQEIYGDELEMFAKKEMQKEVIVPKGRGEILGVVIVESGWGSMLPTVVIANLSPSGAAARCGQLNIGDQIIAINGISLVGLPLSTCQTYIKNAKNQMVVKLTVVPCAPVVEVKIKRPDTKYQLGFSVQNGVICSLLRGGIAERGGVRVGHRIIEINSQSVVAVPHERIVNLLATSVGEILMKTMPTSMFRLLTGQETPVYI